VAACPDVTGERENGTKGKLNVLKGTRGVWLPLDAGGCEEKGLKWCDHRWTERVGKQGAERKQGG
jgi:hypothetical protein